MNYLQLIDLQLTQLQMNSFAGGTWMRLATSLA